MKYQVSKKGAEQVMIFDSYEEAVEFCNSFLALEHARGAEYPELIIDAIN